MKTNSGGKAAEIHKQKVICNSAWAKATSHPIFAAFRSHAHLMMSDNGTGLPLSVDHNGYIYFNPTVRWSENKLVQGFCICLLHLGMGQVKESGAKNIYREAASFIEANRFLSGLKFASTEDWPPEDVSKIPAKSSNDLEIWLMNNFKESEILKFLPYDKQSFILHHNDQKKPYLNFRKPNFLDDFARGITNSIESALDVAAGRRENIFSKSEHTKSSNGQLARTWLLANFPLLSGIAGYFKIIESMDECRKMDVQVGMINVIEKVIYLNPGAGLSESEWIWVLAHEYMHAGLNHLQRQDGRDKYLWNVACDFAINSWLHELNIGSRPSIGVLYDAQFKGWSAEKIYEFITQNIRSYRKTFTLAGYDKCDMVGPDDSHVTDAENFCRQALVQGMFRHQSNQMTTLPADLIETIYALDQPIIPWDVQLGTWFDLHVAYPDNKRSYMRPSRRQASLSDTPLPRIVASELLKNNAHTFGVILDTSGSMSRNLLAKALGTIAQYAMSHDVPGVRLVYCDAAPYDAGYIRPDDLLTQPIKVQGRGGTFIQPAVDYFESLKDFPEDAPILVITDGFTDTFHVKRTHAYVLPKGRHLPFSSRGDVFYIS